MKHKDKIKYRSGSHLTLECSGCSKEKLNDPSHINAVLETLAKKLDEKKLRDAYVFPYAGKKPIQSGFTGIILLPDSHIAVHTFPERGEAFIDVFSFKEFESNLAVNLMVNSFEAKEHKADLVCQGSEIPSQAKLAGNLALEERDCALTSL